MEINRTREGWTRKCTHCGNKAHATGGDRAFRLFADAMRRFREQVSVQFPDLARLNTRGLTSRFRRVAER